MSPHRKRKVKQLIYAPNCDNKNLKLQIGLRFKDAQECKVALQKYAIFNGHNIRWVRSKGSKLDVRCVDGCPWKCYGKKMQDKYIFIIKTFIGVHTSREPTNRQATTE